MPRPHSRRLLLGVAVLAIIGAGGIASAQNLGPVVEKAHLAVSAPPDCATADALIAGVGQRSQRIAFTTDASAVPRLHVTLRRRPDGSVEAELNVSEPRGRRSQRRLVATNCKGAVEALALLITLTLDPAAAGEVAVEPQAADHDATATTTATGAAAGSDKPASRDDGAASTGARDSSEVHTPASTQPAPDASSVAASAAAATSITTPVVDQHATPPAQPPSSARPAALGARNRIGFGLFGQAVTGIAPHFLPGVGLFASWTLDRDSAWSPSLRLRAAHLWISGVSESGGVAAFALDAANLDACPLLLRIGPLALAPCATAALGRLSASGTHTYLPRSRARFFALLGGALLLSMNISGPLELQATAGVGRPLVRDSFAFGPDVFHRVSAVSAELGLGLGLRFP